MAFFSLFRRTEPGDGAVAALETLATGISPAFLDAAAEAVVGRRERSAGPGEEMVVDALGQKLLHAWLQNRHQTLVPLTLNLRLLSAEQLEVVAGALAALLLAGRSRTEAEAAVPALRTRLAGLGADAQALDALDRAVRAPPPLNEVLERAQALDLAVYAYVAALMASDPRFAASVLFCDVMQARFNLSSAVVRSAMRRYRR